MWCVPHGGATETRRLWLACLLLAAAISFAIPREAGAFELGPLTNLSNSPSVRSHFPEIAQSGDNAYVLWLEEGSIGALGGLKVTRIGEEGATREHTAIVGCRDMCWDWKIAASERYVFVTWAERTYV